MADAADTEWGPPRLGKVLPAQPGGRAVGADEHIADRAAAVGEVRCDPAVFGRFEAGELGAEAHHVVEAV